jgi:hypothetical protein
VVSARDVGIALALAFAPGCLIYPDSGILEDGQRRGFAPREALAALVPGSSTRADVLCALGQPDWASADGSQLAYWTREVQWILFAYVIADLALEASGDDHFLLFRFDERGRLAERAERTESFSHRLGSTMKSPPAPFDAR